LFVAPQAGPPRSLWSTIRALYESEINLSIVVAFYDSGIRAVVRTQDGPALDRLFPPEEFDQLPDWVASLRPCSI
jgi:hypothetical protein